MPHRGECSTKERWCLQCGRVTQRGDSGCHLFSSIPRATNPSLSLCDSSPLCTPHLEPSVSVYECDFVHGPFNRVPVSLADASLSQADRIPADFHRQMSYASLFQALVLWAGEPSLGLRSHSSQGAPPWFLRYPSGITTTSHGSGTSPFCVSVLLTSLNATSSVNSWL